jgi:16S rRNA (uracil1498-N3)-methyltransferase
MNRIILEEKEFIRDSRYRLDSRKSNHIIKILKAQVGDSLKAGLLNSSIGLATVEEIDLENHFVNLLYRPQNDNKPLPVLSGLCVFAAIQRPQTVKKMIQLCANCGVPELFFFPAEKSEFSYLNSSLWSDRNLLDEIILGLEQGGRVIAPKIQVLKNKYRIKEHLTEGSRFLLDFNCPYLTDLHVDLDFSNSIQIVLGPESGLIAEDIDYFLSLGFENISVSESILRSEVALSFFLAQIELLKRSSA